MPADRHWAMMPGTSSQRRRRPRRARLLGGVCALSVAACVACVEIDSRDVLPAAEASGGELSQGGSLAVGGSSHPNGGGGAPASGGAHASGGSSNGGAHATGGSSNGGAHATGGSTSATGHAGRAGSGGSGAVGGASGPPDGTCLPLKGDPTQLSIDDLDDGDNMTSPQGKRLAFWFGFNDNTNCIELPPVNQFVPTPGGALGTSYSANISGTGCLMWGAGMGFDFNRANDVSVLTSCTYDVGPYTGISFYAKSTRPFGFYLPQMDTLSKGSGGGCDVSLGMCEDHYQKAFPSTSGLWIFETVRFKDLTQLGFGQAVLFNPAKVVGVRLQVTLGASANDPYDLSVDQLNFIVN
jgi:hypothetical protein